ncbi:MAG TPA: efflux RND transporter periplasmic adaptor subunit [Candidatus Krumholzibacteriaceae bacterium]|nr:efflux RND transporter periplasmic adaptor subunit [Candidatus Krumholzibacteriaceae bacterium]
MKRKYWILTGVLIVIAVLIIINLKANRGKSIDVQVEKVQRRNLKMIITASGSIRPKRKIDVSASTIGKITSVSVKEGDYVEKGQFLMQIDPEQLESSVMRIEASLQSARAASKEARFRMKQRKNELDRVKRLFEKGFRTEEDVETAQTAYNVAVASLDASIQRVAEQKALLKSARHDLKEVTINSGMSGVVTRLNVEEGETAIMGTINNPGTVLMTIADLSKIEAEVEIDETEVVYIKIGDEAGVTLDAFPDTTYRGEVTEIGNSPVLSSSVSGQQGVDFKVVITLHDTIQNVRPGLSADAEIVVAERDSALSIPIQSLTVRESNEINDYEVPDTLSAERKDIEGVFVISEDKAKFRRIEVGISGSKYFEVVSGLAEGEQVVSGNYKAIRDLEDDQRVEIKGK